MRRLRSWMTLGGIGSWTQVGLCKDERDRKLLSRLLLLIASWALVLEEEAEGEVQQGPT